MSTAVAVVRQEGEGERMWFAGGGIMTWKVTAEDSGGALVVLEDHMEQGKVTPLHTHPNEDELIYVFDGELLVHSDGEEHRVRAGGLYFAPRGLPHAFMVTSEGGAHVLGIQTPGTGEQFYRDAGEPLTAANATQPADFARLRRVATGSPSIELLGPPPFAPLPV